MVSIPVHALNLMVIDAYASLETRDTNASIERINRELPVTRDRAYVATVVIR